MPKLHLSLRPPRKPPHPRIGLLITRSLIKIDRHLVVSLHLVNPPLIPRVHLRQYHVREYSLAEVSVLPRPWDVQVPEHLDREGRNALLVRAEMEDEEDAVLFKEPFGVVEGDRKVNGHVVVEIWGHFLELETGDQLVKVRLVVFDVLFEVFEVVNVDFSGRFLWNARKHVFEQIYVVG